MTNDVSKSRSLFSQTRLDELQQRLGGLDELKSTPSLTVFGAGSYARLEASQYSDIDMFFLSSAKKDEDLSPRTNSLRMFGKVIDVIDLMKFPKFSNDCEYLVVLRAEEILSNLGSRTDDHENYFTARMLLLLESHCLYGEETYKAVTAAIVKSYFIDFPDHQQTFQPVFLLNDICRFWKTLLLNYENKRSVPLHGLDAHAAQIRKTKQKVRNFKLKYSRMTTCYASVAALGSHIAPVNEEHVIQLTSLTPRQRLEFVAERLPQVKGEVNEVLDRYEWFLEMTGLPTPELEAQFSDKQKRTEMFKRANDYGDTMFKLIQAIDATDDRLRLVRLLVI
jgi:predicted nucleotidyltransferase